MATVKKGGDKKDQKVLKQKRNLLDKKSETGRREGTDFKANISSQAAFTGNNSLKANWLRLETVREDFKSMAREETSNVLIKQ